MPFIKSEYKKFRRTGSLEVMLLISLAAGVLVLDFTNLPTHVMSQLVKDFPGTYSSSIWPEFTFRIVMFGAVYTMALKLFNYVNIFWTTKVKAVIASENKWTAKDWISEGGNQIFDSDHNPCLISQQSHYGCLFTKNIYRNPSITFDFHSSQGFICKHREEIPIQNQRVCGMSKMIIETEYKVLSVLFRAQNLENFLMMQIKFWERDQKPIEIIPHTCIDSQWGMVPSQEINDEKASEAALKVIQGKSIKLQIRPVGENIYIKIDNYETCLRFPRFFLISEIYHNDTPNASNPLTSDRNVKEVPFFDSKGMIGFRAYHDGHQQEGGCISNLKVTEYFT